MRLIDFGEDRHTSEDFYANFTSRKFVNKERKTTPRGVHSLVFLSW